MNTALKPFSVDKAGLLELYSIPQGSITHYQKTLQMPKPRMMGNKRVWLTSELDDWVLSLPAASNDED